MFIHALGFDGDDYHGTSLSFSRNYIRVSKISPMRFQNFFPTRSEQGGLPRSTILHPAGPLITSPPRSPDIELLRRQSPDIRRCGYINGNKNSELRCTGEYTCASASADFMPVFGCCNDVTCSQGVAMTCVDMYDNMCKSFAGACDAFSTNILSCPTACITYLIAPTAVQDFYTWMSWSCGTSPSTVMVLRTTTRDLPPDTGGVRDDPTPTPTPTPTNPVRGSTVTNSVQQAPDSDPTTNMGTNSPGGQSNPHSTTASVLSIGLIIGVVIGVVLLLVAFAWGVWWWIRRSKRKSGEAEREAARQRRFNDFNPGGQSEAFLMSEAGQSTARWIHNGQGDRMSVR